MRGKPRPVLTVGHAQITGQHFIAAAPLLGDPDYLRDSFHRSLLFWVLSIFLPFSGDSCSHPRRISWVFSSSFLWDFLQPLGRPYSPLTHVQLPRPLHRSSPRSGLDGPTSSPDRPASSNHHLASTFFALRFTTAGHWLSFL